MQLEELASLIIVLIFLALALRDVRITFWPKFTHEKSFQHLTYFVIFALFLLWSAQASVKEGLQIHFLALTTLTMMYGRRCAFVLTLPVTVALVVVGKLGLYDVPEYLLLSVLLPILISYAIFALSYHYLPRNIFVFIFVAGFFNGGMTGSLHLLLNTLYQLTFSSHDWHTIYDNYLIFVPLLAFPEGLLNGMALAILSVFKPEWLRVFSDRDYIYNHYHK
ncbi:energy-coupling factor ABC transporter permease [Vibrio fluvialis]|nr:energy-coupling factor ABC transporter permease [Vibrio fluvialis]ELV8761278.1 energy-coupling factor ABC transporter permease [Vibrio fluvialis]ELV8853394.1 energy-coupling factor ABC transporter permease [Vibrio fluvialis]